MNTRTQLDEFTLAYIECALWAETDNDDKPLDDTYTIDNLAPETLETMIADCKRFQEENAADLAAFEHPQWTAAEMGGHDFWLTRNGHGCGFWDGDWPEGASQRLTVAAKKFGEVDLYVGDDGRIYG
jgi:hypothetical protein